MAKWCNVLHANCNGGMNHNVHAQVKISYLNIVPTCIWCLSVGAPL